MLSHTWLSFFPVKPFAMKELMTSCVFWRRKKERLWLMVSLHCCLYFLLIILAGFLFLTLALLLLCQNVLFCLTDRHLWRLCSFVSAFSQALLSPSQAMFLVEVCSSKNIGHFKPSHKVCVFPALTSFLPRLLHLPKGLNNENLLMLWFFPASAYSSVRNFWRPGDFPKCLRWVTAIPHVL